MWEKRGPRGTRPVLSSTGMWCSPSITTASGRPERPCFFDTNSFGFSAAESIYTRSPWTAYRSRVVRAAWSEPIERYRKNEAPISQRRASATKPWARLWFTTPVSETAAVAASCAFSPSASSGPSSGARPRLSHQLSGQYPNFSMSAAEMSSEGGTRSHPQAGLYVFVSCSQFPEGDGRRDGDEGVQRNE